jgi:hypothetical protein
MQGVLIVAMPRNFLLVSILIQRFGINMGDYKPTFLVLGLLFPILATIFVALRIQAKYFKTGKKNFNLAGDDWTIFVALVRHGTQDPAKTID